MLMLALVRTPYQHDQAGISDPPAQAIPQSDLPVAGLQERATAPGQFMNLLRKSNSQILSLASLYTNPILRTGPPGYIGWRYRLLGMNSWAP
jgi:hypothetical protein